MKENKYDPDYPAFIRQNQPSTMWSLDTSQ